MEHSIKLSGKFNVEFAPQIDKDYEMRLTGSISSIAKTSNEDGTFSYTYNLKPLYGEILNDKGETVKVVKKGSQSQLMRNQILALGYEYDETMQKLRANLETILENL